MSTLATLMKMIFIVLLLTGTPLLAASLDEVDYTDPGWKTNFLPQTFDPLKSRVALKFHLNSDKGASDEERRALARSFHQLRTYEKHIVLGEKLWPQCKCAEFKTVLESILALPAKAEQDNERTFTDDIFIRLVELGSAPARELLIQDIQTGFPRLSCHGLSALPEKPMPELDSSFEKGLAKDPHRSWNCSLEKFSYAVGRYGTPRLLPVITQVYDSAAGKWACAIQAGLLHYMIKFDADAGLARLEEALESRGQPGKNNCYGDAICDAIRGIKSDKAKSFALRHLYDADKETACSAARYLMELDDREALIQRVLSLPPVTTEHNGLYYPNLRESIIDDLILWARYNGWRELTSTELDRLEAGLSPVEKKVKAHHLEEQRQRLSANKKDSVNRQ